VGAEAHQAEALAFEGRVLLRDEEAEGAAELCVSGDGELVEGFAREDAVDFESEDAAGALLEVAVDGQGSGRVSGLDQAGVDDRAGGEDARAADVAGVVDVGAGDVEGAVDLSVAAERRVADVGDDVASGLDGEGGVGTTYYYRVLAGDSPTSNAAAATTLTVTVPVPASGLSATKVGKNKIKLTWTDNSSKESGFRPLESPDGRTWKQLANVPANTFGHTDAVTWGVRYYYCVAAFNSAGCLGFTAAASAGGGGGAESSGLFY
jgi:hypothetical protein